MFDNIFAAIEKWMRELLSGMVESNLSTMFTAVNQQTSEIAAQVGQTPQGWNSSIFSMIRNISDSVVIPIAGIIITLILCYELISMLTERNNLHDVDTWMFFKYFVKMWIAVYLVSHTFDIAMAVFDIGQSVVNSSSGIIRGNTAIDISSLSMQMQAAMATMAIGELVTLALETLVVSWCLKILSVVITVIMYGRMIEIYLYTSLKNAHKVNFVRYADDFVVTAATPELALEAKELIREFLAERGLELSDEKTVVTNIDDGFDFLGWNFRKYNEKLIIKPSKKAVKAIVSNISDTILRRGKAWQQDVLIMKLNEQIRGWTNYHQSVCASDAFAHLDYVLYELLWRWAKRRHPKKNKWWISTRYWHRVGNRNWVFSTENKELIRVDSTAIVRHTKIKASANPFLDEAYFQKRKFDKGMHRLTGKFKTIWKNQNGLCYHCGMPMDVTEEREIFYLAPKAKTGTEDVRNMRYVHCSCQRIYAENRLKK